MTKRKTFNSSNDSIEDENNLTFEELLVQHNIAIAPRGHRHTTRGWIQFDCPFCGVDTHKYHMGYSAKGVYVNCWSCGHHTLVETLEQLLNISKRDAVQLSKSHCQSYQIDDTPIQLPSKVKTPKSKGPMTPKHRNYLISRGLDPSKIEKLWGIEGILIGPPLNYRIWIPIYLNGVLVSWTTRSIAKNAQQRYISASTSEEAYPHKQILFGEEYIRHNAILINEGPIDVFKFGPGATCTFGLDYTQHQIRQMTKYQTRIVCFDNDKKSQRRAKKLCDTLGVYRGNTYNIVLDSKDIGEATDEEINFIRQKFFD